MITMSADEQRNDEQQDGSETVVVPVESVSSDRRDAIVEDLRKAGMPSNDVMVNQHIVSDGLPSRIVQPGKFAPPLPDLPSSEDGQATLAELRAQLVERLPPEDVEPL